MEGPFEAVFHFWRKIASNRPITAAFNDFIINMFSCKVTFLFDF